MNSLNDIKGAKDIKVFNLLTLEESMEVISYIKTNSAIFCVKNLKKSNVQRSIDLICGAIYCLDKKICKLDNFNFLIT